MKAFFEEYGFIVLSAVVVLLLIGMASGVGSTIETSVTGIVSNFTKVANDHMPSE